MVRKDTTWLEVDEELCNIFLIGRQRWYIFYDLEGNYLDSKVELI